MDHTDVSKPTADLDALMSKTLAAAEAGDWVTFRSMFAADAVLHQNVGRAEPIDAIRR